MQSIKRIVKQVLIVVVGVFTSLSLCLGIGLLLLQPSKPKITDKTVLHVVLHGKVVEHAPNTLIQFLTGREREQVIDLLVLREAIKRAQEDKHIRGIYLEVDALKAGWASLETIRNALLSFQKTGKFIVAYGEHYSQKTYYLASLADEVVLHPGGIFDFRGLSHTVFFYKTLLSKLEVSPEIFRVGKYKSAVEPFTRQEMSQASKRQNSELLHAIYDHFLNTIATARGLKKAALQAMADALLVVMPRDAHQANLVSQVGHSDTAEALIKIKLGLPEEASVNYISFGKYASFRKNVPSSKNNIAVLIAEGDIVDGMGTPGTVSAKSFAASLNTIRKDTSIKAVVLRINSPGGSALAADVLWRELILTKAQKPVVASMSDIAASGGYYLAAACNRILAHPTTITGSIGIFGLFFDVHALLSNKMGITTDVVKTGSSADLFENLGRPFSTYEREIIQKIINEGYRTFLERVAAGRGTNKAVLERVAAGRIWTGQLAKEKGLVDELGGLEEAIQVAAKLAGIEDVYTVSYWPKPPALSVQVRSEWETHARDETVLRMLQRSCPAFQHVQTLANMTGIQARLPYLVEVE
ncbi:MAG: signal peptide peptidase SppA [Amoebophilaceae bacterium]|nr:signal peptide peptidase SppA [Amoebophilaceae bacterium]